MPTTRRDPALPLRGGGVRDRTYGPGLSEGDHLDSSPVDAHAERLRGEGLLKDKGRVFCTHLFHATNPCREELSRRLSRSFRTSAPAP